MEALHSHFRPMLIAYSNEDLLRMYGLVKGILEEMTNQMEMHITHQGAAAIGSCGEQAQVYIQSILEVHNRYSKG